MDMEMDSVFDLRNPYLALFSIEGVPLSLSTSSCAEREDDGLFLFSECHPFDKLIQLEDVEPDVPILNRAIDLPENQKAECSNVDVNANVFVGHKRERERDANSNYIEMNPICQDMEPPSPSLVRAKSPRLADSSIGKEEPLKAPRPIKTSKSKMNQNSNNNANQNTKDSNADQSLWNFEPDDGIKRRGRPRKSAPMKQQEMEDILPDTSAYDSVKKIPCFFARCTHAYHRPGSSIVERSDRTLGLDHKYDGITIRTCKKHHEVWKKLSFHSRSTCEVCRGLNCDDKNRFQKKGHSNSEERSFQICDSCASRQRVVLKLPETNGTGL